MLGLNDLLHDIGVALSLSSVNPQTPVASTYQPPARAGEPVYYQLGSTFSHLRSEPPTAPTMQKLLKRTVQVEKQAARRKAKRADIKERVKLQEEFKKRMNAVVYTNRSLADARRRRREDWELGPLAPRRDTPLKDANSAYWGTTSISSSMDALGARQKNLACQWAGGAKYLCLKVGDRVAIMQGQDKGKIGTINNVDVDEAHVTLEGENLKQNFTLSDHLVKASEGETTMYTQLGALRVPIQAVRLVHPLRNEKTGLVRDVIINELKPVNIFKDKPTNHTTWSRLVPGLNVVIPWPRAFEDAERNKLQQVFEDNACDTLREDVEQTNFTPSLLRPPMPIAVVDELRNKYSKFRTRHTADYIQQKEDEAAVKVVARQQTAAMLPNLLKGLSDKTRAEKLTRREPKLSKAMLEKIGELMLRAQEGKEALQVEETKVKAPEKVVNTEAGQAAMEKRDAQAKLEKLQVHLRFLSKKKRAKEEPRLKFREEQLQATISRLSAAPESRPEVAAPPS